MDCACERSRELRQRHTNSVQFLQTVAHFWFVSIRRPSREAVAVRVRDDICILTPRLVGTLFRARPAADMNHDQVLDLEEFWKAGQIPATARGNHHHIFQANPTRPGIV